MRTRAKRWTVLRWGVLATLLVSVGAMNLAQTDPPSENSLTVHVIGHGTVMVESDPEPSVVIGNTYYWDHPTEAQLTAVPEPDWEFDGWSGDITGTQNPTTLEVRGVKEVTARFDGDAELVVQSLTVEPSASALGTELTATIVIKNLGVEDVITSFYTDFYEDRATAPGLGDWGDAYWTTDFLAAGATRTFTHTFTPADTGEKRAWAQVDTAGQVSDSPHVRGPVHYEVLVALPDAFQVRRETGDVLTPGAFYGSGFHAGSADLAEWVAVSEPVEPGHVLEIDPEGIGQYRLARGPCTPAVAGVVSTAPGMVLGTPTTHHPLPTTHHPPPTTHALLALLGVVPVKVTDEGGPIAIGDLLVVSSTPGHAMRWDPESGEPCGLVGKALEPDELEEGSGVVLSLLTR